MSDLDVAWRRLGASLDQLERAIDMRLQRQGSGDGSTERLAQERDALAQEVGALRGECQQLAAALRQAEQDRDVLRDAAGVVVSRLNGSIDEIDQLLVEG